MGEGIRVARASRPGADRRSPLRGARSARTSDRTYSKSATDASTSVATASATRRSLQIAPRVEVRGDRVEDDPESAPEEKLSEPIGVVDGSERAESDEGEEGDERPVDQAEPKLLASRREASDIPDRPTPDDGLERGDLGAQDVEGARPQAAAARRTGRADTAGRTP